MAFYLFPSRLACGDEGVRTPDLVVANHALSQLSYIPIWKFRSTNSEIRRSVGLFRILGFKFRISLSGGTWIRTKDLSFIRAAL